jgi:hypothetical protein
MIAAQTWHSAAAPPLKQRLPLRVVSHGPAAERFTLDGCDELEEHVAQLCEKVLAGVRTVIPARKLEGLLLGGGYGRGEGGVLRTEAGERPYNDLDFYVLARGNRLLNQRRYQRALRDLGEHLSPSAGAEVEFKIISRAALRSAPPSMFYYDLVTGHRWLLGDDRLLKECQHHRDPSRIPLSEATCLLMNRCSGLLFAAERLKRETLTDEDADFVNRNIAKAELAFGDAVLTFHGQYHWSCLERHDRLQRMAVNEPLPWLVAVRRHHATGVKFKLEPQCRGLKKHVLEANHEAVTALALPVWLWLEKHRLNCRFDSARDYALSPVNKWPIGSPSRNRLVNARVFGARGPFMRNARRHPRGRLLNSLARLLWEPRASDLQIESWVRDEVGARSNSEPLSEAYRELWQKLN